MKGERGKKEGGFEIGEKRKREKVRDLLRDKETPLDCSKLIRISYRQDEKILAKTREIKRRNIKGGRSGKCKGGARQCKT